ncbi:MAG: hypothetical protein HGB19_10335 [Chlorobiales bacterium]|nr:hypothetical protein [Chlorobiales bacterium]
MGRNLGGFFDAGYRKAQGNPAFRDTLKLGINLTIAAKTGKPPIAKKEA